MTRHTIETIRATIETLRDTETVYKSEVDTLSHNFARTFDQDWDLVKKTKHLDVERSHRDKADTDLYFAAPYEVRHWYGNKFSYYLEGVPSSEFKDATVSHRNRWRPLFNALQDLKKRQTKGRKPVVKDVVDTRTQMRATCPCCFRDQAVKGDTMVAHGYTLDYGFQNGNCHGHNAPHFGLVEGMMFTQGLIKDLRNEISQRESVLECIRNKEIMPRDRTSMKVIEDPTPGQWAEFEHNTERDIRSMEYHASQLQKQVDGWTLQDARKVEVEVYA